MENTRSPVSQQCARQGFLCLFTSFCFFLCRSSKGSTAHRLQPSRCPPEPQAEVTAICPIRPLRPAKWPRAGQLQEAAKCACPRPACQPCAEQASRQIRSNRQPRHKLRPTLCATSRKRLAGNSSSTFARSIRKRVM